MLPPMSQRLKAEARRTATVPQTTDAPPSAGPTSQKRRAAPAYKKNNITPKVLDISVTVSVGSHDIDICHLQKMETFIEQECVSGLCSVERGGTLSRRHLQMVCRIRAASVAVVSKRIKHLLGWDEPGVAPPGHHVLCKSLKNVGLHTYVGMIGYCMKDRAEEHFQCVHRNISDAEIEEGLNEYVKHGTPFAKNRTVLTHKNLIERAATFARYKLNKHLGSTLPSVLLHMLRSGQFIPSVAWVLPARQGGMEYVRASALWKCMIQPSLMNLDEVTQIFFEYSTPGARIADLGRQRLAALLDEAREGTHIDYDLPDITLGDAGGGGAAADDVIVIDDDEDRSSDRPLWEADAGVRSGIESSVTQDLPEFIPVAYGTGDTSVSFIM